MKNAIITIALVVLGAFLVISQNDLNQMQRQGELIYEYACQAAETGALDLREDKYSEGYIVFDESTVASAMQSLANSHLKLNLGTMKANNGYFHKKITVTIYTLDDSMKCTKYIDGSFSSQVDFSYGQTLSTITGLDNNLRVDAPTVAVLIDAGSPRLLSLGGEKTKIKKMGVYSYLTDGERNIL